MRCGFLFDCGKEQRRFESEADIEESVYNGHILNPTADVVDFKKWFFLIIIIGFPYNIRLLSPFLSFPARYAHLKLSHARTNIM